jgi:hypothetical protein
MHAGGKCEVLPCKSICLFYLCNNVRFMEIHTLTNWKHCDFNLDVCADGMSSYLQCRIVLFSTHRRCPQCIPLVLTMTTTIQITVTTLTTPIQQGRAVVPTMMTRKTRLEFGTPVLSTLASYPSQSLHLPLFQSFPIPSIPMQQSRRWS